MIKTAELTGKALDWALAVAIEKTPALDFKRDVCVSEIMGWQPFSHADPAVCLGLIKKYHLPIFAYKQINGDGCLWQVNFSDDEANAESWVSLEEAVARCVVAMQLGDEVEVPDELVGETS